MFCCDTTNDGLRGFRHETTKSRCCCRCRTPATRCGTRSIEGAESDPESRKEPVERDGGGSGPARRGLLRLRSGHAGSRHAGLWPFAVCRDSLVLPVGCAPARGAPRRTSGRGRAELRLSRLDRGSIRVLTSLREHRALCPNHLMYWSIIQQAIADGRRVFDFGRSTPNDGTFAFMEQWGALPEQLFWEYSLLPGATLPSDDRHSSKCRARTYGW